MSLSPTTHQWHDCSQILPGYDEEVLVYRCRVFGLVRNGHITISQCRQTTSGPVWDCDQSHWGFLPPGLIRCVTHWMPLPAAPDTEGA